MAVGSLEQDPKRKNIKTIPNIYLIDILEIIERHIHNAQNLDMLLYWQYENREIRIQQ
jgi:hypothetical protein